MADMRPHAFGAIRQPRFLLAPLGWVLDQCSDVVESDPRLLGALHQPDQVVAKIRHFADSISLPANLPPALIGAFRRVDSPAEIRRIAAAWNNCLAEYLYQINNGVAAIYLADSQELACLVSRCDRLGWFLADAKGPHNAAIGPTGLAQTYACFAEAEIPDVHCLDALKAILTMPNWPNLFFDAEEIAHLP